MKLGDLNFTFVKLLNFQVTVSNETLHGKTKVTIATHDSGLIRKTFSRQTDLLADLPNANFLRYIKFDSVSCTSAYMVCTKDKALQGSKNRWKLTSHVNTVVIAISYVLV